jgi:hypothetical protein
MIQEIGLAIGRRMDLILLVESGVRQPGGLQGNLEYITFDRNSPEKSFGKVLEMIRAILPKAKALSVEESGVRAAQKEKPEGEEKTSAAWLQPNEDWKRRKYEIALLHMILEDDQEGIKKINDAYLNSKEGKAPNNRENWESCVEYYRLISGKGGKLSKLEEFVKAYPDNSDVQRYLAKGYEEYKEYLKAAKCFETAANKAETEEEQLKRHGEAAVSFTRSGALDQAKLVINNMRELSLKVENGEEHLIKILREIAEIKDDKDLLLGLTERFLELRPDDVDARFSLAHKYSQSGLDEHSLFHYFKIPYQERGSGTWNNIGVEFAQLELVGKSVKAYRKSEELGETLAMSNLAQKLISAGFLDEAEKICNEAVKIENYHKNVGYAITRIKDVPEEENKKEKEIIENATPLSEFYKGYGHALTKTLPASLATEWQGPQCKLRITQKKGILTAEGSYETETLYGGLLQAVLGYKENAIDKIKSKFFVKYEGEINGMAIKGTILVEEEKSQKSTGLLTSPGEPKDVLMIISDDLTQIRIYEKKGQKGKEFYTLNRIIGNNSTD